MYQYTKLPLISIIPEGVMKSQLRVQLDGLSGNMDQLFPDLDLNNSWLGGTGESWERGPYYLSGLIPLAFLTGDPWALERMHLWVEAILQSQQADGNFGPAGNYDWWPRMIVLKAFVGCYQATEDVRILDFMEKYFRFQYEQLDRQPLHFWASARAFEALEAIEFLYSIRPQPCLLELVEKLRIYAYDFFDLFDHFPYKKPMTAYTSRPLFKLGKQIVAILERQAKKRAGRETPKLETRAGRENPKLKQRPGRDAILRFNRGKTVSLIMKTHGVNLAMALKYPAVYGAFTKQPDLMGLSRKGYEALYHYHGNSTGLFSCDEHLMGTSPVQGIELCSVVELMYSLEEIGRATGEVWAFELLEFIAYNSFPAMFTPDMTAHQYVQQPNQAACDKKPRAFFDTDSYANTFGIAPNYGCCAANMHAGFPLFAGYLALVSETGLTFPVYGACTVRTAWNGAPLEIIESGDYPFAEKIRFDVTKAKGEVELHFRTIANTDFSVIHNGSPVPAASGKECMVSITASMGDVIEILCPYRINIVTNPDGSKSIRYGNLLMAMELPASEIYIKGQRPFHDRGFVTKALFNKTPVIVPDSRGDQLLITGVMRSPVQALPFAGAPVSLVVKARYVKGCRFRRHSAYLPLPEAEVSHEETTMTLVPYGTTRLRISHFPIPNIQ